MEAVIFNGTEGRKPLERGRDRAAAFQRRQGAAARRRGDRGQAPAVPLGGQRVLHQRHRRAAARDPRAVLRHGHRQVRLLHHGAGAHRPDPLHPPRGAAHGLRGGRGHHQVPDQGPGGRAQAGEDPGEHPPGGRHPGGGEAQPRQPEAAGREDPGLPRAAGAGIRAGAGHPPGAPEGAHPGARPPGGEAGPPAGGAQPPERRRSIPSARPWSRASTR